MPTIFVSVLLLLGTVQLSIAQGHRPTFSPEDTLSFVNLQLLEPTNEAYANKPVRLVGNKGHEVTGKTDSRGYVRLKVPIGEDYILYCGSDRARKPIKVKPFPYVTYNFKTYTHPFIRMSFKYNNPAGKPLEGEEVTIYDDRDSVVTTDSTDARGMVEIYLPMRKFYRVGVKYYNKVYDLTTPDTTKAYKLVNSQFTWMGAKEKERRMLLAEKRAWAAKASAKERLDSLAKATDKETIVAMDVDIPISYGDEAFVEECLKLKAAIYKKHLEKNPKFFEEHQKPVLAALSRVRKKDKRQIVVTDITGSMWPYMEEVLLWHALNFMDGTANRYAFFNDGDAKSTNLKTIGSTGGLYFCEGKIKDFNTILKTMRKGMNAGGGGDAPENDMEALIAASRNWEEGVELILIADNYSAVRDLSLLTELKIPVRVVLCGIEGSLAEASWSSELPVSINEEYLFIAHQTGGSVHTLEEDIMDLSDLKDGGLLHINGQTYEFNGGNFTAQERL